MTKEQYLKQIDSLELKHKKEINALHIEYAMANNHIKEGDVVKDHAVSIKVEKIKVTLSGYRNPQCIYEGVVLRKDGTPNVRGKKDFVYQSNIK